MLSIPVSVDAMGPCGEVVKKFKIQPYIMYGFNYPHTTD